jgi:hypothetical protein
MFRIIVSAAACTLGASAPAAAKAVASADAQSRLIIGAADAVVVTYEDELTREVTSELGNATAKATQDLTFIDPAYIQSASASSEAISAFPFSRAEASSLDRHFISLENTSNTESFTVELLLEWSLAASARVTDPSNESALAEAGIRAFLDIPGPLSSEAGTSAFFDMPALPSQELSTSVKVDTQSGVFDVHDVGRGNFSLILSPGQTAERVLTIGLTTQSTALSIPVIGTLALLGTGLLGLGAAEALNKCRRGLR